jgi:hypothetical protein
MRFLLRLFSAFCVATVVAQLIILGLVAARGNLHRVTMTKAIALFNGIDISGIQLQKALETVRTAPVPTYDDVLAARAQQNLNLEMRERSIQRYVQQLEAMQADLKKEQAAFDRRKEAFYDLLDQMAKQGKEGNLGEIQRTLEALPPDQAKTLLIKMLDEDQLSDVVAIIKGMALDKRKKILGEFTSEKEVSQLYEVLNQLRLGEPTASVIDEARNAEQAGTP